jgi:hypothetical protein
MTRVRRTGPIAVALLVAAALSGCTSAAATSATSSTATISTAHWPTAGLYSTGKDATELSVPSGARTLHVDFSCTSGLYAVSPAIGMDTRSGMCGGAQAFDFDVAKAPAGSKLRVDFTVPDDTRFVAGLRFSPRPFSPDPTTRRQCAALSSVTEAYSNADQAVDHGDATAAQWVDRTAAAKGDLAKLAAAAKAGPSAGLLGPVIRQLNSWLSGPGDHPGGFVHAPLGDFTAAQSLAGQICSANGTPITVHASYGG